jgi:hypothetical protein
MQASLRDGAKIAAGVFNSAFGNRANPFRTRKHALIFVLLAIGTPFSIMKES